jgi:oligosaccharide translocation protein RFT1
LQLYNSIVLWFAKEAVRKTVQRKLQAVDAKVETMSAKNMVLISQLIQLVLAVLVYLGVTLSNKQSFDHFETSIAITVVAALVESLCEPFYALMLIKMDFTKRAKAESTAIFVKSVLIYFLIFKELGLLGYALA